MAVYPFVGGVSGNPFKNLAREDLKLSKTWIEFIFYKTAQRSASSCSGAKFKSLSHVGLKSR